MSIATSLALVGCSAGTTSSKPAAAPPTLPAPGRPFAATSFWDQRLPAATPEDPDGPARAAAIRTQITKYYGTATINIRSFASPVYTVGPGVPTTKVTQWDCQSHGFLDDGLAAQLTAVPLPAGAQPSTGTDNELTVWQPSSDTLWELWRARIEPDGTWQACWGGRLEHASTSDGRFPFPYGTTATGLPLLGGLIRIGEVQRGRIGHVVDLALVDTQATTFSWPATRTDGNTSEALQPVEGQRFRLPAGIDLDALHLSPLGRLIAEAVRDYGLVIRDRSGSVTFYGENPAPLVAAGHVDPWNAILGATPEYKVLDRFPWDRLEALPLDYGKPA